MGSCCSPRQKGQIEKFLGLLYPPALLPSTLGSSSGQTLLSCTRVRLFLEVPSWSGGQRLAWALVSSVASEVPLPWV